MTCKCGKTIPVNRRKWCSTRCLKRNWYWESVGATRESIANSESHKGRRAELYAMKILPGCKDMNLGFKNHPFDILWNGKEINVKSCEKYRNWWVFNSSRHTPDFYLCICYLKGKPVKTLLIPSKDFGKGISVGKESRYDRFTFRP